MSKTQDPSAPAESGTPNTFSVSRAAFGEGPLSGVEREAITRVGWRGWNDGAVTNLLARYEATVRAAEALFPSPAGGPPMCSYCSSYIDGEDNGGVFGHEHLHPSCFREIETAKRAAGASSAGGTVEHGSDLCECGEVRAAHKTGGGSCALCGCERFRLDGRWRKSAASSAGGTTPHAHEFDTALPSVDGYEYMGCDCGATLCVDEHPAVVPPVPERGAPDLLTQEVLDDAVTFLREQHGSGPLVRFANQALAALAAERARAEKAERAILDALNLEWDDVTRAWWLPGDPGPVRCPALADALREHNRIGDNEHRRMEQAESRLAALELERREDRRALVEFVAFYKRASAPRDDPIWTVQSGDPDVKDGNYGQIVGARFLKAFDAARSASGSPESDTPEAGNG